MNAEIVEYLKSSRPDFDAGFVLFCKYSRNQIAMNWISRRRDKEKLLYELGKLAETTTAVMNPAFAQNVAKYAAAAPPVPEAPRAPEPAAAEKPAAKTVFRTFDERRTRRSDLPPEYQALFDENAEDHKLKRGLHEKMKMARTDDDRASFRARILETDARIRDRWAKIDEYQEQAARAAASADNFKESTCRSYISSCLKRNNTPAQVIVCKAKVQALLDHGCKLSPKTVAALKDKGLM